MSRIIKIEKAPDHGEYVVERAMRFLNAIEADAEFVRGMLWMVVNEIRDSDVGLLEIETGRIETEIKRIRSLLAEEKQNRIEGLRDDPGGKPVIADNSDDSMEIPYTPLVYGSEE